MPGRPKKECFEYNKQGKFIKSYTSETEVLNTHYSHIKGRKSLFITFSKNKVYTYDYVILPNGNMLVQSKIGRDAIKLNYRKSTNNFLKLNPNDEKVAVYNLDNKKIASFASAQIAHKMTGIPLGTIWHQLNVRETTTVGYLHNQKGLLFKYE